MKCCFASNNLHKIEEIQAMMGTDVDVQPMSAFGFVDDIPETGETLEENSLIKARTIYEKIRTSVISDDSGLEVHVLNGEPGVYSARYAGKQKNDLDNMRQLLKNLEGQKDRRAQFRTVITFYHRDHYHQFEGIIEGKIIESPRGDGGFGYDPVFVPNGYNRTFAEMGLKEKNTMSHRARAFEKFASFLDGN